MDVKDLIDSSSILMERFKDVCPGTYRHCQNTAQFVETIAKELDLNVQNLVVAATLHDIGKCNNPSYFIENQVDNKNPHDDLDPPVSFQYISRHVSDSVLRLVQAEVPTEIVRLVSEHHGDSIIRSIHVKAKEKYNGKTVEEHYRYKSCKPSSVEACILMICDVVESACRALHNAGKLTDYRETINNLIFNLTEDTQIDILTLGELRIIQNVLVKEVTSLYHKRLEYKDDIADN